MERFAEVQIFPKASKSFEDIRTALGIFIRLMEEDAEFVSSEYYRGRNCVKDAEVMYQEGLKNARKLLGPIPEYSSEEFIKWRAEALERQDILVKNKEFEDLKSELLKDSFLRELMNESEIIDLLDLHYLTQQEGRRKLVNIKVRIIFAKLFELLSQAKEMQKEAFARQYT